jgi:nucleoside 2-deoxyribosyltransferase
VNIYTATKWERREQQNQYNREIERFGHRITHDWTVWEEQNPSKDATSRRHAAAMMDYAGVMQCELLILWDHPDLKGACWEAGMAAARGVPIWIVDYKYPVVFDGLPMVRIVSSWNFALSLLAGPTPLV